MSFLTRSASSAALSFLIVPKMTSRNSAGKELAAQFIDDLVGIDHQAHAWPNLFFSGDGDADGDVPVGERPQQVLQRLDDVRLEQREILKFELVRHPAPVVIHQPVISSAESILP